MEADFADIHDPIQNARECTWDAWDAPTLTERKRLALKALEIDSLCADAYNVLASCARQNSKRLELYKKGIDSFLERIEKKAFDENIGDFWAIQFRPFLRSVYGYGTALWDAKQRDSAITQFRYLLTLDTQDHLDARIKLVYWLISEKNNEEAKQELAQFPRESYHYIFGKLFLELHEDTKAPAFLKAYEKAKEADPLIIDILTGRVEEPEVFPESYTIGSREQSLCYYEQISEMWHDSRALLRTATFN